MSGVKGENSLKLFGDDFDTLTSTADRIYQLMTHVRGVTDVGVFNVGGQPSLLISIDRAEAARYGIAAADINNAVQAAVGGAAVTQIIEGERRFDFAVRFTPQFRDTPEAIRKISCLLRMATISPWECSQCHPAQWRFHDLSRGRKALHPDQVQRARP